MRRPGVPSDWAWEAAFDGNRSDGVVDTHPYRIYLRGGPFGAHNVFLANGPGADTDKYAGNGDGEIQPGRSVTLGEMSTRWPSIQRPLPLSTPGRTAASGNRRGWIRT